MKCYIAMNMKNQVITLHKTKLNVQLLAEKGLFLRERMNHSDHFTFIDDVDEHTIEHDILLWQEKAGGNGEREAFLKRLEIEDLTLHDARYVLRPVKWKDNAPFPAWVQIIDEIHALLPITVNELKTKLLYQPKIEKIDTYYAILPFIYYAENQLLLKLGRNRSHFHDDALANFTEDLAKQLDRLIIKTCKHEFEKYLKKKHPLFVLLRDQVTIEKNLAEWKVFQEQLLAGRWLDLVTAYPVLARLVSVVISNWINHIIQFAERLRNDLNILSLTFNNGKPLGKIYAVEAGVSDVHHRGKSVVIITFEAGVTIVYKPRSLAIDIALTNWFEYMRKNDVQFDLIMPKAIDRSKYGWMEYIEHKPLQNAEDAHTFYFRAGILLGVIYMFGGNDFHFENIIASSSYPVLIDTETLFLHKVKPFNSDGEKRAATEKAEQIINSSVLRTGLLPIWRKSAKGKAFETGALTCKACGEYHLPVYKGEKLDVHSYMNDLIAGLKRFFTFIEENRENLLTEHSIIDKLFSRCYFRYIVRPTQTYGDLLDQAIKPQCLTDGLRYSIELERIAQAYLLYASKEKLIHLWHMYIYERNALEMRDIPIFYSKAKELSIKDGEKVLYEGYFAEHAIQNCKQIISQLDEKEKRWQIGLIHSSLAMHRASVHTTHIDAPSKEKVAQHLRVDDDLLLREAMNIYDEIVARKICGDHGDFTWIVKRFDLQSEKISPGYIGYSLYDGIIGISTFMAALYAVTQNEEIKKQTLTLLTPLRARLYASYNPLPIHRMALGLGSGVSGIIRGLMLIGQYLQQEEIIYDAIKVAKKVRHMQIDRSNKLDIMQGAAGLINVLAELYNNTVNEEIVALAKYCGENLLISDRMVDDSEHNVGSTIFSYALIMDKLGQITGDDKYKKVALEVIKNKDIFNHLSIQKGEHLRKESMNVSLCSGLAGVGIALTSMLTFCENRQNKKLLKQEIEAIVQRMTSHNVELRDHYCCGMSGVIDFLIEASDVLNRPELLTESRKQMGIIIARKAQAGRYKLNEPEHEILFNPSFFQGLAGIGYQMLRCIKPNEIKSVMY